MNEEQVLAIPSPFAYDLSSAGLTIVHDAEVLYAWLNEKKVFLPRSEAETNSGFKQVIPYVVITRSKSEYLVLAQRKNTQQEIRLHNKYSIGMGGHINESDLSDNTFVNCAIREVNEELVIEGACRENLRLIGVLNDNSDDVGKVHVGLVYSLITPSWSLDVRETGKHQAEWASLDRAVQVYSKMERWSQIVFDNMYI